MTTRAGFASLVVLVLAGSAVARAGILDLAPGTPRGRVEQVLAEAEIDGAKARDDEILLAAPVLPEVFATQRALLRFDDDRRLRTVAIQIHPDPGADGRELLRLWDDVRHELIRSLDAPAWERDEVPPGDPLEALARRRLVKLVQWEDGHVVRLGIPYRVDGEVLIEVLITSEHLSRTRLDWGSPLF